MLPSPPRLSLPLALALAACTSTADLPAETSDPVNQATVYAVTVAASPLESCAEPAVGDVLRAPLVELRGERRLLLRLASTPAIALRPPGACSVVSSACGHFRLDYETDDPDAGVTTLYTSAAVAELPLPPDVATVWVTLSLLDDIGRPVVDQASLPVVSPRLAIDVFAPGDPLCVAPADGG